MKHFLLGFALLILSGFVACAQHGTGPDPVGPALGPIGAAATGARSCQVGQIYEATYGCLDRHSCQAGFGWIPAEFRCIQGTLVTDEVKYGTSYGARFVGGLQVTNGQQFALMLKYAHLCDPYWVGWNFGTATCSSWTSRGGFIEIRTSGAAAANAANVFIGAGTTDPNLNANWSYQYGSGYPGAQSSFIGLSQQAVASDYNNSMGTQLIGIDASGSQVGLRVIAPNGKMSAMSMQVELYFQNVPFATATVERR